MRRRRRRTTTTTLLSVAGILLAPRPALHPLISARRNWDERSLGRHSFLTSRKWESGVFVLSRFETTRMNVLTARVGIGAAHCLFTHYRSYHFHIELWARFRVELTFFWSDVNPSTFESTFSWYRTYATLYWMLHNDWRRRYDCLYFQSCSVPPWFTGVPRALGPLLAAPPCHRPPSTAVALQYGWRSGGKGSHQSSTCSGGVQPCTASHATSMLSYPFPHSFI